MCKRCNRTLRAGGPRTEADFHEILERDGPANAIDFLWRMAQLVAGVIIAYLVWKGLGRL
jgi:hypothetical protein